MGFGIEVLELSKGDKVIEAIKNFVTDKDWQEGLIMGAIGSVINVTVNNAAGRTIPPPVKTSRFEGPFEVLSFIGEVLKKEGETIVHIHTSGSLSDGNVFGGGLQSAEVFKQFKVYLQKLS